MYRTILALCLLVAWGDAAGAATTRYEAEKSSTNIPTEKRWAGYSGSSYLCCWGNDGQYVTFSVNATSAGVYTLAFGYSAGNGPASRRLTVNNAVFVANQTFAATTNWSSWKKLTMNLNLKAGTNIVKLDFTSANGSNQFVNLDYLDVAYSSPISVDGSTSATPNGPSLITNVGIWTWAGAASGRPGEYYLNLNGTNTGIGSLMEVAKGGNLYVNTVSLGWYLWQSGTWVNTNNPNNVAPTPVSISLSPASATVNDKVPIGTKLSTATVTMSDGSSFTGTLTTSNTDLFAISGRDIVTKRLYTPADYGTRTTTISIQ
jgi:hypothetical protein